MSVLLPRALRHTRCPLLSSKFLPKPATTTTAKYSTAAAPPSSRQSRTLKLAAATATLTALLGGAYTFTTPGTPSTLNPTTFTPYTLSTTPITDGPTPTRIFTLTSQSPSAPNNLPITSGILSLQIKQPQLQIARSYTPLPPPPPHSTDTPGTIRLLIKKEPGGEMSRYLYSQREGATVELRGPHTDYAYTAADLRGDRKVVFFAGGTGIAPALQVAAGLGGRTEVLWAVRRREETEGPMKAVVEGVVREAGGRVSVGVFVDGEGGIQIKDVERAVKGRTKVFVSGPEGFIGWIAGPKEFRDGREEQGVVGGVVGAVLRRKGGDVEVFKL